MRTTPDDNDLLARVALGEKAAMERLAADYHLRLWRYLARQLGGDVSLIEDVLQEVYLAIWRSAELSCQACRASRRP
jgi:DNA-directed RNA polymerase specialized sigma24 family protein